MERLIYSKFSNERNARYAIETNIVVDEADKRWVIKRPMDKEGRRHFDNMKKSYQKLKEMFADTMLGIQPCEEFDDGMKFPYIEGEDMEKYLHQIYNEEGYDAMLKKIKEYFALIRRASSGCEYHNSSAFDEMFGPQDFPVGTKCGLVNNLDYGFANVINSKHGNVLIDYEWTVDFPVPLEFLLYRALHYYVYMSPNSMEMQEKGIFKDLGFEEKQIEKYIKMEQHFQSYISSGKVSLGELHETMGQQTYNIHEMEEYYRKAKEPLMQIYFDYGEGFVHENSYYDSPEVAEDGTETLIVTDIPDNAMRVRVDPRKEACVIRVDQFVDENGNDMQSCMECNAINIGEQVYVFNVPDPWFVVKHENCKKLILQLRLKPSAYVSGLDQLDKKNQELKKEIEQLEKEKQKLNQQIDITEERYQKVVRSRSWKITEPLRKIGSARKK